MTRIATIDIDTDTEPPAMWCDEWVRHRLVESYRIEQRLPGGNRTGTSIWPPISYEFADVVGWDDARERVMDQWSHIRGGVFAVELTRMEQAHEWLRIRLAAYPAERTCLAHWATAIAYNHSLRALLFRRRWSRSTFYRRVEEGSRIITASLIADDVAVT